MKARLLTLNNQENREANATNLTEICEQVFNDRSTFGFSITNGLGEEENHYFGDVRSVSEIADAFIENALITPEQAEIFKEKCSKNGITHYVRTRSHNHRELNDHSVVYDQRTSQKIWPKPNR
jgi:hypothetical protein